MTKKELLRVVRDSLIDDPIDYKNLEERRQFLKDLSEMTGESVIKISPILRFWSEIPKEDWPIIDV